MDPQSEKNARFPGKIKIKKLLKKAYFKCFFQEPANHYSGLVTK
jgi:hypothetical protein